MPAIIPDRTEPETTRLRRRLSSLENDATTWKGHWEELRKYIDPFRGRFLTKTGTQQDNDGSKQHSDLINNYAELALDILAAGIQSGLASPTVPWLRWSLHDLELLEIPGVREYLADASLLTRNVLRRSNFYKALYSLYKEMGLFGTGAVGKEKSPKTVVFFRPLTIGEYYLAQDAQMRPSTLIRRFSLTVEQLVTEFGADNVSKNVAQSYKENQLDRRVPVVHVIQPRASRRLGSALSSDAAYESIYFEETEAAAKEDKILRRGGFRSCPFVAGRWEVIGSDVYGRSPGMRALPHVKQLQAMDRDKLRAINRHVNPPMRGSYNLKAQGGGSLVGGSITYLNPMDQDVFEPAINVSSNIGPCVEEIQRIEGRIDSLFYADRLLAISQIERQMTAYEVRQRTMEKLQVLGPVVEPLESEVITPLIEGTWEDMVEWGMIPPAPPEIQGLPMQLEYLGLLSQVQRGQDSITIESVMGFINAFAAAQASAGVPSDVLDKVDFDQGVDEVVQIFGAPPRMFRDDQAVAAIRAQRAAQQEQQAKMAQMQAIAEQAPNVAGAAKTASETRFGNGRTFLDTLYGIGG